MRKSMSLYIHIPFCNSKCHYCAFVSEVAGSEKINRYIDSLKSEIKLRGKEYNPYYEVKTLYIGGGTPSALEIGKIKEILLTVYKCFTVRNDAEITIEINPNTLTREKAIEYLSAGINRFSIGLQSASPALLKLLGRTHTYEDFANAVKILRDCGATNISADMMLGLPSQSLLDVSDTIEKLVKLNIPHISGYLLSIEEGTNFEKLVSAGCLKLPTEPQSIKLYNHFFNSLVSHGYIRYEFSNFARVGFQSKHNIVYWNREPYLGLGVSAHSFMNNVRFANTSDLNEYSTYLESNTIALSMKDEITIDEQKEEVVMLSLRLAEGIDTQKYANNFGVNLLSERKKEIADLIKDGFLILDANNHLKATNKGFLVLNKLIEILT